MFKNNRTMPGMTFALLHALTLPPRVPIYALLVTPNVKGRLY